MIPTFLALAGLWACGSDTTDDSAAHDSGHDNHHTEACGISTDHFMVGMTTAGTEGVVEVVLVSADPAPPDKGDNVVTVQAVDATDGAALDGATLVLVPFMPEHGHGSSPESFSLTATGNPGEYVTETFDLFMGGVWDLTFQITTADAATDEATFRFCIEG